MKQVILWFVLGVLSLWAATFTPHTLLGIVGTAMLTITGGLAIGKSSIGYAHYKANWVDPDATEEEQP